MVSLIKHYCSPVWIFGNSILIERGTARSRANHGGKICSIEKWILSPTNTRGISIGFFIAECPPFRSHIDNSEKLCQDEYHTLLYYKYFCWLPVTNHETTFRANLISSTIIFYEGSFRVSRATNLGSSFTPGKRNVIFIWKKEGNN